MRKIIRWLVWSAVGVAVFFVLSSLMMPKIIIHRTLANPLFREFRFCKILDYSYELYDSDKFGLKQWIKPRFKELTLMLLDTLSRYDIKYHYNIYIKFGKNNDIACAFCCHFPIKRQNDILDSIKRMECDSLFLEIAKLIEIKDCFVGLPYSVAKGAKGVIHYDYQKGIVYFKLINIPEQLAQLLNYEIFIKKIKEKGFTSSLFDSLIYIGYGSTWRIQGFSQKFGKDFVEVGNYGSSNVNLKWLSNPDTINPIFLLVQIYEVLMQSGLEKEYISNHLILQETGAIRDADYCYKDNKVIEASRITGYFKFYWKTGTWIDKMFGGFKIKVYFKYTMGKRNIEFVRIGTSPSNFYEKIYLRSDNKTIEFEEIVKLGLPIDTTRAGYKLNQNGDIILTFRVKEYRYEVNLVSGSVNREPTIGFMCCCPPSDVHIYSNMEWSLGVKRGRAKQ